MKTIPLTQGKVAMVDDEDFEDLSKSKWYALWQGHVRSYYAIRGIWNGRNMSSERMHRRILGLESGDKRQVDHINHDTLDNRKENLRIVTHRENQENRRNKSKHGVGVYKNKSGFQVMVYADGKLHYLGMFRTTNDATEARNRFLELRRRLRNVKNYIAHRADAGAEV